MWVRVSVFNTTFNNISVTCVCRGRQFYWWRKSEYLEKTTDLSQTLSHNVVSSTHLLSGIQTHGSGDRH